MDSFKDSDKARLRLSAMLIFVESDSGDTQDLIERLLDSPAKEAGEKPRRSCTDLDTKCHVHITSRAGNLSSLDIGSYALIAFPEFFGITPDLDGIMWQKFVLEAYLDVSSNCGSIA